MTDVLVPVVASPAPLSLVNVPNAITLAGYALTVGWLLGGPWWMAGLGLIADEADGRVARATGQTSEFGSLFDWAVDLTLTGLVLNRVGALWALPPVTVGQVYLREKDWRPPVGSARAGLTLYALYKERGKPGGLPMKRTT